MPFLVERHLSLNLRLLELIQHNSIDILVVAAVHDGTIFTFWKGTQIERSCKSTTNGR